MYDSVTGEVYGKGNVKITQNYSRMTTEDANGNLNTGDVDIPVPAHVIMQVETQHLISTVRKQNIIIMKKLV